MMRGFPLKSAPGYPALNLMEETQKMKYEGKGKFLEIDTCFCTYVCVCICMYTTVIRR